MTFGIACSKDDDNSSSITPGNVSNTVTSGYSFTFATGGVLTAVKTGSTVTGTWSTGTDDSKTELVIGFASPASFVEISDDWEVIENTSTKIRLQDVSGGNGGTDLLTFEKN